MENKTNERVPMAILSCFLIAFILQGTLKMAGVFVFDKALTWDIFRIIDNTKWLQIIYYSIIVLIIMYCLSFSLTTKPYSKKWYHYLLLVGGAFGVTIMKYFIVAPMQIQFVYDVVLYVVMPIIINVTTDKQDRIFENLNLFNVILMIVIHISLYFCYLGLTYWSSLICSMYPQYQIIISSSAAFLTRLEVYIALASILFIPKKNLKIKGE